MSAPCVLCGGREWHTVWVLPVGRVLGCRDCGLVSLVDGTTGLPVTTHYDENYYRRNPDECTVGYPDYFGAERPVRAANARVFADLITSMVPHAASSLDIGCGGGYLVDALFERGLSAAGIDSSAYVVGRAHEVSRGWFDELPLAAASPSRLGRFPVVTMMDVIEHLLDPVGALAAAAKLVAPAGTLFVLTPRYGGRLLAEQAAAYVHFNVDHVHYFTVETLRMSIDRAFDGASIGTDSVVIDEVLDCVTKNQVSYGREFAAKYGTERDSILAIVRLAPQI